MRKNISICVILFMFSTIHLHPYSLNAFTTMTGKKTCFFYPTLFLTLPPAGAANADVLFGLGLGSRADIMIDIAGFSFFPQFGYTGSALMPRFAVTANQIIAISCNIYTGGILRSRNKCRSKNINN